MPEIFYSDEHVTLWHGDCLDAMRTLPGASVDAVVTDPPYGLEFMGKGWDAPWRGDVSDVNADAGFNGGGISATRRAPSFTGSTNPKCLTCKGTRRGRRDGTAKVAVCLCADGGKFPNVRATEMRAFGAWCEQWVAECLRVLKPGGMMLSFGGTRTWHRLACAIEDAGFEIRDSIAWLYGSGFSKGRLLGNKAGLEWCECGPNALPYHEPLDDGARRGRVGCPRCGGLDPAFRGFSTTLKPAFEPIVVARKPLGGTVAANVLEHGTGALNIDGCRVEGEPWKAHSATGLGKVKFFTEGETPVVDKEPHAAGRWPANVVLDDTQAAVLDEQSGERPSGGGDRGATSRDGMMGPGSDRGRATTYEREASTGGASRFFPTFRYEAKAPRRERPKVNGTAHPTVKPIDLMRWLVRLVTPPGGVVVDPFAGSGTTVEACILEGLHCLAIERESDYLPLIVSRIHRRRDPVEAIKITGDDMGLFAHLEGEGA